MNKWEALWEPKDRQRQPVAPHSQPATIAGVAGLLRKVATTPEGSRNAVLFWAACRMAEKSGIDHESAALDLINAARLAGLPEREAWATVRSAGLLR